jgi:hypothetical protein
MPSTPQNSTEALDDDAIKVLFEYADWDVRWNADDMDWLVRPQERPSMGFAAFSTLQDALEYMLMYNRLKALQEPK